MQNLTLEEFKANEEFILTTKAKNNRNDPYKIGNAIIMEINYIAG